MLQPSPLSPSFTHLCLADFAKLHSHWPKEATKYTLLHTCAALARLNKSLPRAAAAQIKAVLVSNCARAPADIKAVLLVVADAVRQLQLRTRLCVYPANVTSDTSHDTTLLVILHRRNSVFHHQIDEYDAKAIPDHRLHFY